jgi:ATP-dependent exoDNAse (exonuclease V) alpha subunit
MVERYGAAELSEIRRQREGWARDAVHDLAHGHAIHALERFESRGYLDCTKDPLEAMSNLSSAWSDAAVNVPDSAIMLANTHADVAALNALAQGKRRQAGLLSGTGVELERQRIFCGDRVLFTRNSMRFDVFNGDLGTVQRQQGKALTILLDSGRFVTVDADQYPHLQLGYCVTTHKAQGLTTEQSFVLMGGSMQDREIAYVQASRARAQSLLFAAEERPTLDYHVEQSRKKTMATQHEMEPSLTLELAR